VAQQHSVIIIGAGPAGLSLACSLAQAGLHATIIEKQPREALADPAYDGREIALTHLSVELMRQLGIWQLIPDDEIGLIKKAQVQDGVSPYSLDFDHRQNNLEALGYLVSNHLIRKAVFAQADSLDNIDILTGITVEAVRTDAQQASVTLSDGPVLQAALAVAADSRFSETRRKMGISASMHDFGRVAIVSRMSHARSNEQTAFECFQYGGTLAILPVSAQLSSFVVTASGKQAQALLALSDDDYRNEIRKRLGSRLGDMTVASERFAYPLVGVHADRFIDQRFALIGDAAVGMHPVTAHGFNLGLRGQNTLTKAIIAAASRGQDIGAPQVLQQYQRQHRLATLPMYYGTNGIVKLFTSESPPAKLLRQAVLRISNNLPPLKWAITRKLTEVGGSALSPLKSTRSIPQPQHDSRP